jgi:hypothetical protein
MMVAFPFHWLSPVALCAATIAVAAQTPPPASRKPDPLDAGASVPAVAYESAFKRNRRAADDMAIPWRESNDTAARIGGWRAYAREALRPEPAPAAASAPPANPDAKTMTMPQGPGGRKMP